MFHEDTAGGWQLVAVDVNKPHGRAPACLQVKALLIYYAALPAGTKTPSPLQKHFLLLTFAFPVLH